MKFPVHSLTSEPAMATIARNAKQLWPFLAGFGFTGYLMTKVAFSVTGNCGGTLIDPLIVLTAAHCLYKNPPKAGAVVNIGPTRESIRITSHALHPEYGPGADSGVGWAGARRDVAVIILEKPATSVKPAPRRTDIPPAGTMTYHIGKGENPLGYSDSNLYYGTFILGTYPSWYEKFPELLGARGEKSPTGNGGDNERYTACPGDSGGPLIWGNSIIGTGACIFLEPCGTGYSWWPSTAVYNPWIDSYVKDYGANPPLYAPPGCYDVNITCAYWLTSGECTNPKFDGFMKENCKLSCGFCDASVGDSSPPSNSPIPSPPSPSSPSPKPLPSPKPNQSPWIGCKNWSYMYWKDRRYKNGSRLQTIKASSLTSCFSACVNKLTCNSFQWQRIKKDCVLYSDSKSSSSITLSAKDYYAGYLKCSTT